MEHQNALITLAAANQLDEFAEIMATPNRQGLTANQIAEKFSISPPTIYSLMRRPEIQDLILTKRREIMVGNLHEADEALLRAVRNDQAWAVKLMYERWDDLNSRQLTKTFNQTNQAIIVTQANGQP